MSSAASLVAPAAGVGAAGGSRRDLLLPPFGPGGPLAGDLDLDASRKSLHASRPTVNSSLLGSSRNNVAAQVAGASSADRSAVAFGPELAPAPVPVPPKEPFAPAERKSSPRSRPPLPVPVIPARAAAPAGPGPGPGPGRGRGREASVVRGAEGAAAAAAFGGSAAAAGSLAGPAELLPGAAVPGAGAPAAAGNTLVDGAAGNAAAILFAQADRPQKQPLQTAAVRRARNEIAPQEARAAGASEGNGRAAREASKAPGGIPHSATKPHKFHRHQEDPGEGRTSPSPSLEDGRPVRSRVAPAVPPGPAVRRVREPPTEARRIAHRPTGLTRSTGVAERNATVLQCTGAYGRGDSNEPCWEVERRREAILAARRKADEKYNRRPLPDPTLEDACRQAHSKTAYILLEKGWVSLEISNFPPALSNCRVKGPATGSPSRSCINVEFTPRSLSPDKDTGSILLTDENAPRSFAEVLMRGSSIQDMPRCAETELPLTGDLIKEVPVPVDTPVPPPPIDTPMKLDVSTLDPALSAPPTGKPVRNTRYSANTEWGRSTNWLTQPMQNTALYESEQTPPTF
ncbi:MAG: hypothetical protein BJ554DRAFT_8046, partial [Olpidium bornovanus]